MRRSILLGLVGLVATGCAWFRSPPEQGLAPGATIVYTGSPGSELFSVCDKGNLIYLTRTNPQVAVLPDHQRCLGGLGGPGGPTPLGLAALSERAPRTPEAPPPAAPPVVFPQPFLVQIVPGAAPPPEAATKPVEPREPPIFVIPPPACPACPVPPGIQLQPPVATPTPAPAPRAVPKAPKAEVVVAQVDPNTASTDDLERLPGVSLKMAQEITRKRPYRSVQDLVTKKALTEAEYAALWPYFIIR